MNDEYESSENESNENLIGTGNDIDGFDNIKDGDEGFCGYFQATDSTECKSVYKVVEKDGKPYVGQDNEKTKLVKDSGYDFKPDDDRMVMKIENTFFKNAQPMNPDGIFNEVYDNNKDLNSFIKDPQAYQAGHNLQNNNFANNNMQMQNMMGFNGMMNNNNMAMMANMMNGMPMMPNMIGMQMGFGNGIMNNNMQQQNMMNNTMYQNNIVNNGMSNYQQFQGFNNSFGGQGF